MTLGHSHVTRNRKNGKYVCPFAFNIFAAIAVAFSFSHLNKQRNKSKDNDSIYSFNNYIFYAPLSDMSHLKI